jgi:hypothetical protein
MLKGKYKVIIINLPGTGTGEDETDEKSDMMTTRSAISKRLQ